jgi:hypothetical protein
MTQTTSKVTSELQKLVWDAIFPDKQLRYSPRNLYKFNRKLDEQNYGQQVSDLTGI